MGFLYHFVRKNLRGNILYPLNSLKTVYPDLYEIQAAKYKGREQLMEDRIPVLDCLWNDVLHFSSVHPKKIAEAFALLGEPDHHFECFEIDPDLFEPEKTIVYLYQNKTRKGKLETENFAPYIPAELTQYDHVPDATLEYYREMLSQGKRPLLFHRIPHILYRGNVDISSAKRVRV